jgi:hypothetical protein
VVSWPDEITRLWFWLSPGWWLAQHLLFSEWVLIKAIFHQCRLNNTIHCAIYLSLDNSNNSSFSLCVFLNFSSIERKDRANSNMELIDNSFSILVYSSFAEQYHQSLWCNNSFSFDYFYRWGFKQINMFRRLQSMYQLLS